jgi:hypothetical protein
MAKEPLPDDFPLMRGWRAQHVLPDLLALLEGRRAVRIDDLTKEAPLDYADVEEETIKDDTAGSE